MVVVMVVLQCGPLTFRGDPPYPVEWIVSTGGGGGGDGGVGGDGVRGDPPYPVVWIVSSSGGGGVGGVGVGGGSGGVAVWALHLHRRPALPCRVDCKLWW